MVILEPSPIKERNIFLLYFIVFTFQGESVDLNDYDSPEDLETIGLDGLKTALMGIGLKCGGTLRERAQRLFLTKDTPLDKLDRAHFAKQSKGKNKKKK